MHRDGITYQGGPHHLNDFKIWIIKIIEKKNPFGINDSQNQSIKILKLNSSYNLCYQKQSNGSDTSNRTF
jgi:hypothetical protein